MLREADTESKEVGIRQKQNRGFVAQDENVYRGKEKKKDAERNGLDADPKGITGRQIQPRSESSSLPCRFPG